MRTLYILGVGIVVLLLTTTMTADTDAYSGGESTSPAEDESESESDSQGSSSLSDGLDNFMQGIFDHEGAGPRDRNNNPGNLTAPSDNYWNGQTGKSGMFAVFGDIGDGWDALRRDIQTVTTNHPDWNFFDFFHHYASSPGDNPEAYANSVADYMGVDPESKVSEAIG